MPASSGHPRRAAPDAAATRPLPGAAPVRAAAAEGAIPRADPLQPRTVLLHRQVATIQPGRVDVGPPRSAVVLPLIGVALTSFLLAALVLWTGDLPFWSLPVILIASVILLPLSGVTLIYAVLGASVVATASGQNVSFKQRFLGLGVGTNELVPFGKIRELVVEDVARARPHPGGDEPAMDVAQWEIALIKKSGKRLPLGRYNVARSEEEGGLAVVMDVAEAFAAITRAPIRGPIW